jgi:hypothetical protein
VYASRVDNRVCDESACDELVVCLADFYFLFWFVGKRCLYLFSVEEPKSALLAQGRAHARARRVLPAPECVYECRKVNKGYARIGSNNTY